MVRLEEGSFFNHLNALQNFNSSMVRLEDPPYTHSLPPILISIPVWYD